MSTQLLQSKELYEKIILEAIPKVKRFLWIGTADIKDLYVKKGTKMVPFLEILSDLIKKGIEIRLVFAGEPGPAFQKDFDKYPNLIKNLEQMRCPRVHFKMIIGDGTWAYTGSANLTGAGIGAKGPHKRNFESGIYTTDESFVEQLMDQFDELWIGKHCKLCQRKDYCSEWQ